MICLALDSSNIFCSVGVFDAERNRMLAEISEELGRGHAERLIPAIRECLNKANVEMSDLNRVISTVGPGSFTGVRVGLATARGLALALNIPIAGVSVLAALEACALRDRPAAAILTVMDAKRGDLFVRYSPQDRQETAIEAELMAVDAFPDRFAGKSFSICGSGAPIVAGLMKPATDLDIVHGLVSPPIATVAELGARTEETASAPEPLYLRRPDAKSQTGFAVSLET